jgi:GWxTD domain-containing protein
LAQAQAQAAAPATSQSMQPDRFLYENALADIAQGRYLAARLRLNTLINTYTTSEYLMLAKLAIADAWYREGGAHAMAQAAGEYKDFILFYPNTAEASQARARLNQIDPSYQWLSQDVAYIISDEERKAFTQLHTQEEQTMFVEQFWLRRDPTPGTPENEYKTEHYRRIAFVNEHFSTPTLAGWRTDRGRIYIQYGPPDEMESHPAGNGTETSPFEQWRYRYIDGVGQNIIIEFVDKGRTGEYRMTMDPSEKDALFSH